MTVKELKEKLGKLPDSAAVRLMIDSEDNPIKYYYDARLVYYIELVQKRWCGGRRVYRAVKRGIADEH